MEQLKRAGIEDENTLFFAACNSDEQSLARMHIERLRLQKQKKWQISNGTGGYFG